MKTKTKHAIKWILLTLIIVFAVIPAFFSFMAGVLSGVSKDTKTTQDSEEIKGIWDNYNRLHDNYKDKLALVEEIQKRCDARGVYTTRSCYVEWKHRNNEALDANERLAAHVTENFKLLSETATEKDVFRDDLIRWAQTRERISNDNSAIEHNIEILR